LTIVAVGEGLAGGLGDGESAAGAGGSKREGNGGGDRAGIAGGSAGRSINAGRAGRRGRRRNEADTLGMAAGARLGRAGRAGALEATARAEWEVVRRHCCLDGKGVLGGIDSAGSEIVERKALVVNSDLWSTAWNWKFICDAWEKSVAQTDFS
jgi:hypothetical protein